MPIPVNPLPPGPDDVLTATSGNRYTIRESIPTETGAQGTVLRAVDQQNQPCIIKLFNGRFSSDRNRRRMRWLYDRRPAEINPAFVAPIDLFEENGRCGNVQPLAPGMSLEDAFQAGLLDKPSDTLVVATALAQALTDLEVAGCGHGDIQAQHVFVNRVRSHFEATIIDLDNFHTTDDTVPPPACLGQEMYLAPELRPLENQPAAVPDALSDRFALAVLLSQLILLRHPSSGFWNADEDSEEERQRYVELMTSGEWPHDPALGRQLVVDPGGHPATILNPRLMALFRRGFSKCREDRPAPAEWRNELYHALFQIMACPRCGYENICDASKLKCPDCGQIYPPIVLTGVFGQIVVDRASTTLGRAEFGHDTASQKHVVIRRRGSDFQIADHSTNGTFRQTSSGTWCRLPQQQFVLLRPGDRLKLVPRQSSIDG